MRTPDVTKFSIKLIHNIVLITRLPEKRGKKIEARARWKIFAVIAGTYAFSHVTTLDDDVFTNDDVQDAAGTPNMAHMVGQPPKTKLPKKIPGW